MYLVILEKGDNKMNGKITSRQGILLITICRITTVLTVMSTIYMPPSNQDNWIIIILSFVYTSLSSLPVLYLSKRFNESTIIGYLSKVFGKVVGNFLGILYSIYFATVSIQFSYITIQMIRSSFLTDTKPIFIILFLFLICTYTASKSTGVVFRFAELSVPVILFSLVSFALLGYNTFDLKVFLPILRDSSFLDINIGAFQLSIIFIDILILAMIVPELENKEEINEIFIKSVIYSLIFVLLTVIVTQASLGIEQSKHSNFPLLTYIRRIRAYSSFERIESIYILMWLIAMIVKITIYIHISKKSFQELLRKRTGNKILYTIVIFIIIATYYIAEINPMMLEIKPIKLPGYTYYFIFKTLIPFLALLVYMIRRKSIEKNKKPSN